MMPTVRRVAPFVRAATSTVTRAAPACRPRALSTVATPVAPVVEQRILSGIQPSGLLHLGNYLGAVRSWLDLQNGTFKHQPRPNADTTTASAAAATDVPVNAPLYIFLADLHALTVRPDPAALHASCLNMTAQLLACGIDPNKTTLFIQSHVREHLELSWIFTSLTPYTWLTRMTQFKDKSRALQGRSKPGDKEAQSASLGLFSYPVLQAADILLYRATGVPVGEDQHQHVELCRNVATQFNNFYAGASAQAAAAASGAPPPFVFPLPQHISTPTARVMSLRNGSAKMSKSDPSDASRINLSDSADDIARKVRAAVSDSLPGITYDPDARPAVANLLSILAAVSGRSVGELVRDPSLTSIQQLKSSLTEHLVATIGPIRDELVRIEKDEAYLRAVLRQGAERARHTAAETMARVKPAIGLVSE